MLYTELTIKDKSYKLRLDTQNSIALEKALGYNPILMLMDIEKGNLPKMSEVVTVLHSMLQKYQHGISVKDVYDIMDDYSDEGHNMFDLIPVFIEVYQNCGFLAGRDDKEEDPN